MSTARPIDIRRAPPAAGFSIVELLVVVAIVGILTAFAVPMFGDVVQRTRVTAMANDLVASALRARSEAIKRNAVVSLCPTSAGSACEGTNWSAGYLVWCRSVDALACDPTNTGTRTLVLHHQAAIRSGWRISAAGDTAAIAFQPTGTGATTSTLTICQYEPEAGRQERVVTIGPTGRATVAKTTNGVCP